MICGDLNWKEIHKRGDMYICTADSLCCPTEINTTYFNKIKGTSLVVQWLGLCSPNAGGLGLIPGQGTKSHLSQLKSSHTVTKILHATIKTQRSQVNKYIHFLNEKRKRERGSLIRHLVTTVSMGINRVSFQAVKGITSLSY